ncbi:phosphoribosylanthranilate isomerase [Amnimonas aquatica]|uniref:N-(5'-phosphoribosyl)anthranilate isomerase n=1 Tax=Amnimonas aquatica TaxID=2094561 RepID=A0A2P6AS18_9GAMM|nr:phosphoribosylanthranilate isomerase [Amnimonas aquatica]PQA40156.1 phosphoribosylanthranilate isomerase [Amnimonas aquatica]
MAAGAASRTRVKICGITRSEDALAAVAAGADAIGFVFYAPSPRAVTAAQAAAIMAVLPPFVTTVGLFVNAAVAEVDAVLAQAPLDLLQFHGDEPEADCARHGRPWIKALRVQPGQDVAALMAAWPGASGILLDAWHPELPGGTGLRFDWGQVPGQGARPIILAGGLTPENVAEAIRQTRPYAVDVSGGVEAAKGIKSADRIQAFMTGVHAA